MSDVFLCSKKEDEMGFGDSRPILSATNVMCAFNRVT